MNSRLETLMSFIFLLVYTERQRQPRVNVAMTLATCSHWNQWNRSKMVATRFWIDYLFHWFQWEPCSWISPKITKIRVPLHCGCLSEQCGYFYEVQQAICHLKAKIQAKLKWEGNQVMSVYRQLTHTATHPRQLTQRKLTQSNSPKCMCVDLRIESRRHIILCVYEFWTDTCHISHHELNWHMSHFSWVELTHVTFLIMTN